MAYLIQESMRLRRFALLGVIIFLSFPRILSPAEFYEKTAIRQRMEKREVISVVKVTRHETKKNLEVLNMDAAGIMEGLSIQRAMELISDYENLTRIAPDYIKLSKLIEHKGKKYLHLKTEVRTLLITYAVEIYARVREELRQDKAIVHWEIIPAKTIGRHAEAERFVGLKGQVMVRKYQRSPAGQRIIRRGHMIYRRHEKKNKLSVLFSGRLVKKNVSELVPNFMLKIAMEGALQPVGILLLNYF